MVGQKTRLAVLAALGLLAGKTLADEPATVDTDTNDIKWVYITIEVF